MLYKHVVFCFESHDCCMTISASSFFCIALTSAQRKMAAQTIWSISFFVACLSCVSIGEDLPQSFVTLEKEHNILAWKEDGWIMNEPVGPHKMLKLTFALKQRNLEVLEKVFWQVSDPKSEDYGKHRSIQDLAVLISPSTKTKMVIKSWLGKNRVDLRKCTSIITEDFVTCEMPCEVAESMLKAKFHYFSHSRLSTPTIRSISLYSVPVNVAQHLDFVGGVLRFPAVNWARPKAVEPTNTTQVGIHIGVYPSVLRKHYKILDTVGSHPNNSQVVAQFLGQFYHPSDLSEFFRIFGSSFVHRDAISKVIGPDSGRSGIEASLDTQYIMSTGANITTWFWSTGGRHEKQEPFLEWMVAISNMSQVPWVHSISYGDNEDSLSTDYMKRINVEFQKAGVRGLSMLFASGDDGANCIHNKRFRPSFPSSSPFVTTVGGTAFKNPFTDSDEYGYEISGGGFSNVFTQESYQTEAVANYLKNGPDMPPDSYFNKNGRAYPDISAICNHFWVVNNLIPVPGVLGTSASTPSVAGIISLLNDLRLQNGKSSMGFLNPFLYQNAAALFDVTTGHNEGCDPGDRGFTAFKGWDPVTGNGSPNYPLLAKAALK